MGAEKWGITQRRKNHKEKFPPPQWDILLMLMRIIAQKAKHWQCKEDGRIARGISLIWGEMAGPVHKWGSWPWARRPVIHTVKKGKYRLLNRCRPVWVDGWSLWKFSSGCICTLQWICSKWGLERKCQNVEEREACAESCENEWTLEIQQVCWRVVQTTWG